MKPTLPNRSGFSVAAFVVLRRTSLPRRAHGPGMVPDRFCCHSRLPRCPPGRADYFLLPTGMLRPHKADAVLLPLAPDLAGLNTQIQGGDLKLKLARKLDGLGKNQPGSASRYVFRGAGDGRHLVVGPDRCAEVQRPPPVQPTINIPCHSHLTQMSPREVNPSTPYTARDCDEMGVWSSH